MSLQEGEVQGENQAPSTNEAVLAELQRIQKELELLKKSPAPAVTQLPSDPSYAVLKQLADMLKGRTEAEKYGAGYVDPADIDENDLCKEGVTFFSHSCGYVIWDDKRNGLPVVNPYRRLIVLNYQGGRKLKRQNQKEDEIINLSSYTSYSHKEIKWLRDHTFYGSIFHEKMADAMAVDSREAQKIAKYIISLQGIESHRLINMAKQMGIQTDTDISKLRIRIATHRAKTEIAAENKSAREGIEEKLKEKLFPTMGVMG